MHRSWYVTLQQPNPNAAQLLSSCGWSFMNRVISSNLAFGNTSMQIIRELVLPNRWCVNYTGCRFNKELTIRCLCWHTRLWTRLYHSTSANASIATSMHGHYARRLCYCSSNRSLAPTSRNVLFDVLRCLSGTHFPRLSSEATHCLYSNLG